MPRTEVSREYAIEGNRKLTVILRDSITPEDPYFSLVRAKAFSVCTGEPYDSNRVNRAVKDLLIKTNITI